MKSIYLSERKAATAAGVSRTTLRKHRKAGHITPIITSYAVLYSSSQLRAWKRRFIER